MKNLDCADNQELMRIWHATYLHSVKTAREWFPERPRGYVTATRNLGHYAANKAAAEICRLRGDVPSAQNYEMICDRIYEQLPQWARW